MVPEGAAVEGAAIVRAAADGAADWAALRTLVRSCVACPLWQ